jgi:DNA-binding LytR/AlgR family response regulator
MSKETFDQVDKRHAIEGVIACHRSGIANREKEIVRLEAELVELDADDE